MLSHLESLRRKFIDRGYPVNMVDFEMDRGSRLNRADLLKPKPVYPHQACPTVQSKRMFLPTFIITYNPELRKWLKEG